MSNLKELTLAPANNGMNAQAAILLKALEVTAMDVHENIWTGISPYSNCRERGFVISIHTGFLEQTNIAFYEHRSGDQLMALQWKGDLPISGGVTPDAVDWDNSTETPFSYMDIKAAVEHVKQIIKGISQDIMDGENEVREMMEEDDEEMRNIIDN